MAKKAPVVKPLYRTVCQTCGPLDGVEVVETDNESDAQALEWLHVVDHPDHAVYVMVSMKAGA